jgi:hypothetical protein
MFAIVHLLATFIASASFFIAFSSPAEGLVFIANMALIQASAQRTLNITIGHFVMAVTSLGAGPRHAAEHRCRGAFRQIFARPAPRGLSLTPGREAFHPMDAAGPDHLFA